MAEVGVAYYATQKTDLHKKCKSVILNVYY